jgi:hypothetical protein
MTVASAMETATELRTVETRHMCPERALTQLMACDTPGQQGQNRPD